MENRAILGRLAVGLAATALIFAVFAECNPAAARHRHHRHIFGAYPYYPSAYGTYGYGAWGHYYAPYARPSGPWWDYAY